MGVKFKNELISYILRLILKINMPGTVRYMLSNINDSIAICKNVFLP